MRQGLISFNALQSLPVYPVFDDEKSNGSDKKSVKEKSHKKDRITNVITTNFV